MSKGEEYGHGIAGPLLLGVAMLAALVFSLHQAMGPQDETAASPAPAAPASSDFQTAEFTPPPESAIPDGPDGDAIRRGEQLFRQTGIYARDHVGSSLTCNNCHLDAGRLANASPMWAAWGMYPAYRSKNDRINTMEDRIMGCFVYSMNAQASPSGKPPPAGDDIYRDFEAYFSWLATGAPIRVQMKGRGFLKLADPPKPYDPKRGEQVFADNCSACHGEDGQGMKNPDGTYAFPPLWGEHSFNWGAGMGKIANAAGFIKANMPFGQGYTLTDQEAWDVAAYVDAHERPRDPRQTGSIEANRAKHHKSGDYYGQSPLGDLLGDGKP